MLETFPSVCALGVQGIMALEAEELVLNHQLSAQAESGTVSLYST